MAVRHVELAGIGQVTLQKRRGNRSLRLSISAHGVIRVSLPPWAPYKMAIEYALSKAEWIQKHRPVIAPLDHKTPVGKAHHLIFQHDPALLKPRTRLKANEIIISLPPTMGTNHVVAQRLATTAAIRALKIEAEQLLPTRLAQLAEKHSFYYQSVTVKRLSSRWGSCDAHNNITLNCYLMQLPWRLVDYVLLHELTHTRVMAHGPKFWDELGQYVPGLAQIRKEIRDRRPLLSIQS